MPEYFAGIDIGSTMTKAVIFKDKIIASVIGPTGPEQRHLANKVMEQALAQAGLNLEAITYIIATGYGRINVPFADKQVTEISCHARGIGWLFPQAKTVIDIGGQDSKVMLIENNRPVNFVMNDKCAAGSGRFLEVIADSLQVPLEQLGTLSLQSTHPLEISNICTVWAEQEVTAKRAQGAPLPDLIAGVHEALANRVIRLANRLKIKEPVVLTGGGAKNQGLIQALSRQFKTPLLIPEEPLITGALGAALLGLDLAQKTREQGNVLEIKKRILEEIKIL
ncbi:MAG: 2-hydroxyglutaryl-CoA dehydratase [Desulfobacteraceae bacterium]|nr:MAG: 2-hydroxyglutaryl-CoA dehydratase [Desulfobacteraceae bacterium]